MCNIKVYRGLKMNKEDCRIRMGALSNERGRIINDALWEIETQIESDRNLISNFIVKNGDKDLESLREDLKSNLKNKRMIYNNNSNVELLDKFIRNHEERIEKIRKFEI
jgi:hypothetical protein